MKLWSKKSLDPIVILAILWLLNSTVYADVSAIDDALHKIQLAKPAERIVSLSPGLAELISDAGGLSLLKGVVSYSDFPSPVKNLPIVGSYNALDIEKIVELNPDLIVAWESGNPPQQISKLKKLGFNVYISEPRNFDDIPSTINRLGKLMGTAPQARKRATAFNKRLQSLKLRYPKNKATEQRVFIQIWDQPMMSINGAHLISQIVEQCNGVNIFHDTLTLTLTLNAETVIQADPDVIIVTRQNELGSAWLSRWEKWRFMTAVKNEKLYTVNPDTVVRHTPRILDGIEQVCGLLHAP